MDEFSRLTGAHWSPPQERPDGQRVLRISFSRTPPYIELIQGNTDGLWATAAGPRMDHLAYWSDAFDADCANFTTAGMVAEAGGRSAWGGNWAYFRMQASGVRIELCDTRGRDAFLRQWGLSG